MHHLQDFRLIIPKHSPSIRPIHRLTKQTKLAKPIIPNPKQGQERKQTNKERKKEKKSKKGYTHNRPNKPLPPILLEPLYRILRIPRPLHHLLNPIHNPITPRPSRIRRHIVQNIPQLICRRRLRRHFQLELAPFGRLRFARFGGGECPL